MLENAKDASNGAASVERPQNKNLRPFPKGVSGNPSGVAGGGKRFSERYSALQAEIEASGIPLMESERVTLGLAVRESLKPSKDVAKAALTFEKLIERMKKRRAKTGPATVPLRERLAAEAADA